MRTPTLAGLATLALAVLPLICSAPTPNPTPDLQIRNADANDVIPNSYIIVYRDNITEPEVTYHVNHVNKVFSKRSAAGLGVQWNSSISAMGISKQWNFTNSETNSFHGYQITADDATIKKISASPLIKYIEKDIVMKISASVTQAQAPYDLGQMSHKRPATYNTYIYDSSAGVGTQVYVVDTGIYTQNTQFGGRAIWGANFVTGSPNTDEHGHGTHCAGTVGSSAYGVAKRTTIVAVKVLDKSGGGANSNVISGIQWAVSHAQSLRLTQKSVISLSLGGSYSAALNAAVQAATSAGLTVVVAAGNSGVLASTFSPASVASAITVGAVDSAYTKPSWSNFGSAVDIFAPGVNILSTYIGSTSATATMSGTSMSTPHIAGLAAYLISLRGLSSPAAVQSYIKALGIKNIAMNLGSGSPNLVAYNGA